MTICKKSTEEKFAINEQPVSSADLIAEISPLLDDYFIGDFSLESQSITYSLPNGQKFKITAKRV